MAAACRSLGNEKETSDAPRVILDTLELQFERFAHIE